MVQPHLGPATLGAVNQATLTAKQRPLPPSRNEHCWQGRSAAAVQQGELLLLLNMCSHSNAAHAMCMPCVMRPALQAGQCLAATGDFTWAGMPHIPGGINMPGPTPGLSYSSNCFCWFGSHLGPLMSTPAPTSCRPCRHCSTC
jgi:hypothetical protein